MNTKTLINLSGSYLKASTPMSKPSEEEPEMEEQTVPVVVLQIERKKRRVYQQMLKSITDSPDLPDPLKKKIRQDLKEALQQLSQQTQNKHQGSRAKAD